MTAGGAPADLDALLADGFSCRTQIEQLSDRPGGALRLAERLPPPQ